MKKENESYLMKIKEEEYDLEKFIAEVRKNYLVYGYPETCIPCLFNEELDGKFHMDTEIYTKIGYNRVLTMEQIKSFLNSKFNAVIHICFAHSDMDGNLFMANGREENVVNIETGNMLFKESNSFGINIRFDGSQYYFEQVEYDIDEETFAPFLMRINSSGNLKDMVLELIEKFIR